MLPPEGRRQKFPFIPNISTISSYTPSSTLQIKAMILSTLFLIPGHLKHKFTIYCEGCCVQYTYTYSSLVTRCQLSFSFRY